MTLTDIFAKPFSAARKPTEEAHVSAISEKNPTTTVIIEDPEPDSERISKPHLLHLLSTSHAKSASSCTEEASTAPSPALPTPELEQVQVGFFIAMPRPRPRPRPRPKPRTGLPLRSAKSSSTLKAGAGAGAGYDKEDPYAYAYDAEWPATDSRWADFLFEGELPELTVGVSTISIPAQTLEGLSGKNGHGQNRHRTQRTQHPGWPAGIQDQVA
jgi:hypothetical protein